MPQHEEIAHSALSCFLKYTIFLQNLIYAKNCNVILPLNRVFQHKILCLKGKKALYFINLIEKLFQYWAVSIPKTALQEII